MTVEHSSSAGSGKTTDRPYAKLDHDAIREAAKRWHAELLEKYPEFAITYRDVPDEQNGHLQLILFLEKLAGGGFPGFDAFRDAAMEGKEFDQAAATRWFAEHKDILEQLLRIGELPSQSCKGISRDRFDSAMRAGRGDQELLLLLHARYAAGAGDAGAAARSQAAALGLANHYDAIEAPSLSVAVTAAGIRHRVARDLVEFGLPGLAGDAEGLARARELMGRALKEDADLNRIALGEWNVGMLEYFLPQFLGADPLGTQKFPHPEEIISFYSEQMKLVAKAGQEAGWAQVAAPILTEASATSLTEDERSLLSMSLGDSFNSCFKGFLIGRSQQAMRTAALAIVAGEDPSVEPLTGDPFVWDPATRTLSAPAKFKEANARLEPIKVP